VVVHQLQDVDATVCHHAKSTAEHEKTDAKCAPPSVLPPEIGESVKEDSDNCLYSRELGAKAEGQEHHEEEDRPEGGDWHP